MRTKRLRDHWWCERHQEIHVGPITSWNMDHRVHLHPVVAELRDADPLVASA